MFTVHKPARCAPPACAPYRTPSPFYLASLNELAVPMSAAKEGGSRDPDTGYKRATLQQMKRVAQGVGEHPQAVLVDGRPVHLFTVTPGGAQIVARYGVLGWFDAPQAGPNLSPVFCRVNPQQEDELVRQSLPSRDPHSRVAAASVSLEKTAAKTASEPETSGEPAAFTPASMALMDFSLGLVATGLSSQWTLGLSVVLGGMATALLSKQLQQVCDMKDPFVRHLIALGYCLASYAALSLVIPESVAQVPAFSSGLYLLLGGNLFLLTSLMKNRND